MAKPDRKIVVVLLEGSRGKVQPLVFPKGFMQLQSSPELVSESARAVRRASQPIREKLRKEGRATGVADTFGDLCRFLREASLSGERVRRYFISRSGTPSR